MAALAVLVLASCNKNTEREPVKSNDIIELNLTVAGCDDGADTRAVKKGWAAGDKINLWFDDWNYNEKKVAPPDLIITYDGAKWTSGKLADGRSLKANGKFTAVYEGSNDIMSESGNEFYNGSMWYYAKEIASKEHVNYCDVYYMPMYIYSEGTDYSFADNKLTATISSWNSHSNYKITVKGLTEGDYAMQVLNNPETQIDGSYVKCDYANTCGAIVININSTYPTAIRGSANNKGYTGGIKEEDGTAFYYVDASWSQMRNNKDKLENATILFRLINLSDGKVLKYQVTGKTIELKKRTNIALNLSSFTAEE